MVIGIAVLGAGIFAREEHLPAIKSRPKFDLKAIYSRSQSSARQLLSQAATGALDYYDSPSSPDRSLDDLLARPDIHAVVIALPVLVQPTVIRKAIAAGKHVLSEKPIAKDLETARDLFTWYTGSPHKVIWSVAENFRFIPQITCGYKALKDIAGEVRTFSVELFALIDDNDKFYQTAWRQTPEYQGGFLLDGGIHFVAGIRYLLEAAGQKITHLSAFTALLQQKLAPSDTVNAAMRIENGNSGSFRVSFGMEYKSNFAIEVITSKGAILVKPDAVTVTTKNAAGETKEAVSTFEYDSGVKAEIEAFAESIDSNKEDPRGTPQQALEDLEIVQSFLESGMANGAVHKL